jgi:integrase
MLKTRSGLPKHCTWQKDRDGQQRVRFRRRSVSVYLTGIPWSEDFMRQYAAALEREDKNRAQVGAIKRTLPGSFSALCVSYYSSPEFCGLKASTQRVRRNILERFRREHGHRPLKDLKAIHIRTILGAMAKQPESANGLLKVLRAVLDHAVAVGLLASNAALGVKPYRSRNAGGYPTWTEEEIAQFKAKHPLGSKAYLAFALALYTGQRRGDVVRLGRKHIWGSRIMVQQEKTSAALAIPIHPELERALALLSETQTTFLLTDFGKPFTAAGFGNWFREQCDMANLHHCSLHGLRKAACRRLAEAGCSANEIAAISGHASLREVARYTSAASQRLLADRAVERQLRAQREQNLPNMRTRIYPTAKKQ